MKLSIVITRVSKHLSNAAIQSIPQKKELEMHGKVLQQSACVLFILLFPSSMLAQSRLAKSDSELRAFANVIQHNSPTEAGTLESRIERLEEAFRFAIRYNVRVETSSFVVAQDGLVPSYREQGTISDNAEVTFEGKLADSLDHSEKDSIQIPWGALGVEEHESVIAAILVPTDNLGEELVKLARAWVEPKGSGDRDRNVYAEIGFRAQHWKTHGPMRFQLTVFISPDTPMPVNDPQ